MESATLEAPVSTVREIESVEDLDAALAALGEMEAQEAKANADLDLALTKVRESFQDRYLVTLDDEENAPLVTVRGHLKASVERYCETHRKQLLTGDKKSVNLKHGTIGWTKEKDSVELIEQLPAEGGEEQPKKTNVVLDFAHGIAVKALNGIKKLFTRFPLLDVISVKIYWDKSQVLKKVNDKQITDKQLEAAGLKVVRGADKFYARPKADAS